MTAEFCGYLMKLARDIANAGEPTELVMLCQAEDVFDTTRGANKISRGRLEHIVCNFIDEAPLELNELVNESYVEPEDLVWLGYWTEEDLEKYYEEKGQ